MGFWSNLFGGLLGRAASRAADRAVDKAFDRTSGGNSVDTTSTVSHDTRPSQTASSARPYEYTKPAPTRTVIVDGHRVSQVFIPANAKAYFDSLIRSEFAEYNIKENVHPNTFDGTAEKWFREYTYVLYKDGRAVLAVMLTPHNRNTTQAFVGSRDTAKRAGINFVNFMTHYPNEREYVVNRIKNAL